MPVKKKISKVKWEIETLSERVTYGNKVIETATSALANAEQKWIPILRRGENMVTSALAEKRRLEKRLIKLRSNQK